MTIVVIHYIFKNKESYNKINNKYGTKLENSNRKIGKKFSIFNPKRYFRYVKLFLNSKVLITIMLFAVIANLVINFQNKNYENTYKDNEKVKCVAVVISQAKEKQYSYVYKIKVLNSNKLFYLNLNKKMEKQLEYGDKVKIDAIFQESSESRNYGGFSYKDYLKTVKIYGTLKAESVTVLEKNQGIFLIQIINKFSARIKKNIDSIMPEKEAEMLKGLLLGDISGIDDGIQEEFKISNLSHILAVSGMQVNYIIFAVEWVCSKIVGKRNSKILTIVILILYMAITGFSPSIVRATIMGIILILSTIVYKKNDFWNTLAFSLFLILIYNPFLIQNVGLVLSYLGTIGIVVFNKTIFLFADTIRIKNKKWRYKINLKSKRLKKIKQNIAVTLSAQLAVFPYMIFSFNLFGTYFLITNLLAGLVIEPITIIGIIAVAISFISIKFSNFFSYVVQFLVNTLMLVAKMSNLPFSKIYFSTPKIITVIVIYISLILFNYIGRIYLTKELSTTQKRVKNIIALLKYYYRKYKKKIYVVFLTILIVGTLTKFIPKNLEINFVDVGQGDCTFIRTPYGKSIIIDGGGSNIASDFNGGKSTLLPYVLDKGYTKIDFVVISHMDNDHIGNLFTILEELKVKQVIISKQGEESENYKRLLEIIERKKIKLVIVKAGDNMKFEKNLYFQILWPQELQIQENILNNNSVVAKLVYGKFKVLFTGDIEKIAEEKILTKYNSEVLKSDILKIAHHRFKNIFNSRIYRSCKT